MVFYGMTGTAYNLTKSCLENRHQRVDSKNKVSNWGIARDGVPQGSVLGPLIIFNLY
jgi:hypothetical protein